MNTAVEIIFVVLRGLNFAFAGASRIFHCIRLAAIQGMLLSILGYLLSHGGVEMAILTLVNFTMKGFVLPFLLKKAVLSSGARRELEPLAGYSVSLIAVACATALAFALCSRSAISPISAACASVMRAGQISVAPPSSVLWYLAM